MDTATDRDEKELVLTVVYEKLSDICDFVSTGTTLHCKFAVTLMQESCTAVRIQQPFWHRTLYKVLAVQE